MFIQRWLCLAFNPEEYFWQIEFYVYGCLIFFFSFSHLKLSFYCLLVSFCFIFSRGKFWIVSLFPYTWNIICLWPLKIFHFISGFQPFDCDVLKWVFFSPAWDLLQFFSNGKFCLSTNLESFKLLFLLKYFLLSQPLFSPFGVLSSFMLDLILLSYKCC